MSEELFLSKACLFDDTCQCTTFHLARMARYHDWARETFPPQAGMPSFVMNYPEPGALQGCNQLAWS
jgi:hypothetical protein